MADETGKIYIIVTNKMPGDGLPEEPDEGSEKKKKTFSDFAKHQFYNLLVSETRKAISYTISNIGNFTGDYTTQKAVQQTMSVLSEVSGIAIAALAGSKYGVGGSVLAAGVVATEKIVNNTLQIVSMYTDIKKQNYSINQIRERSGLDSSRNGSRGTEN